MASMTAAPQIEDFVAVDGVKLEIAQWEGAGRPILMLHEGLGSLAMWRDFPDRLAERTGRRVIAWSRRGYGKSERLEGPREPDYMHREAAATLAFMDAMDVERAVLFGHSDGGSIALMTAALAPARVAALILEAPHVMVEALTVLSIAKVREIYESSDLGKKLARYHEDVNQVFWSWNDIWLDPRFREWNIEALLTSITAPALLIQGVDDEYGTFEQLERIEAVLQDTRRLELTACGHSPHRDHPEKVLASAEAFLRSRELYD